MSYDKQYQTEEKRGRPLDLSRNQIILQTTLELLAENGYDALTMDAVAIKAKVGKGTIYRRWSSKMELVIDASTMMSPFETSLEKLNKDQDVRGQLIDLLSLLFMKENEQYQKAMNAICNAVNKQLEEGMRDAFYRRYRNSIESILKPYIEKNHITDDDLEIITDIGPALVMYRSNYRSQSVTVHYLERIVDQIMMPILSKKV
ncbi:TetR/AcrR family transcriptional regulator [Paenibacillus bovis]|uniref:HTH tetR-type domain-containing protein n=1 Tax=Paenibacillus bovis TaxID=1616788 RepID=A0A172ZFL9_9BACL|nr:TetR/AcrR family transcriptional regulator [Paenibacillus bovis]ANF96303.1 hypothetical protein AR543_10015 [Paenibacillus bovis]